jgi:3-oxoacyl-[acyl-carrier-protein] synthase II
VIPPEDLPTAPREAEQSWPEVLMRSAIDQAVADAGLRPEETGRLAVVTGESASGIGATPEEFDSFVAALRGCAAQTGLEPGAAMRHFSDQGPPPTVRLASRLQGDLATRLGSPVVGLSLEATCSTGIRVLAEGARLLQLGQADCVVAASSSSRITPYLLGTYAQMLALSRWRDPPELASRPFDRRRDGMVPGEAAGAMILERLEDAVARGAENVHARVSGWGFSTDVTHPTRPRAEPIVTVMHMALVTSRLDPAGIDAVNTHGTSTRLNDISEARALHQVFAERTRELGYSACKSILGHGSLAAGLVESIVAVNSLKFGVTPPVPSCLEPDPECDLPISTQALELPVRAVLKNAFGFGGQYGAMVFEHV